MKKIIVTILYICITKFAISQNIYTTKKDISDAKEIVFYGFDFSHFKMAENRVSDSYYPTDDPVGIKAPKHGYFKLYMSKWTGYLLERMDSRYFAKNLKTDKVIFDFDYNFEKIKQISDSNVLADTKVKIPVDSIQSYIYNYDIKQKEGIGFTIIVECFYKKKEASSAYFTFFDIATKKILMCDYFSTSHANGIGLTNHWGFGLHYTVDSYISNEYKSNIKSKKMYHSFIGN